MDDSDERTNGEGNADPFGFDPGAWSQGADHFTRMWTDFASKMAAASMSYQPGQQPPEAARQMRDTMLKAWSEQLDAFMRTDQFSAMMRKSLAGMVDSRKQMNEMLGQLRHELQGVSRHDVDELMQSIQHLEQRIADSAERLGERLDGINARLAMLERTQPSADAADTRGES